MCPDALLLIALTLLDARAERASIAHTGDGAIELVDSNGVRYRPGPLEPGHYDVVAQFPGRRERRTAHVILGDRENLTVKCVAGFYKCAVVL